MSKETDRQPFAWQRIRSAKDWDDVAIQFFGGVAGTLDANAAGAMSDAQCLTDLRGMVAAYQHWSKCRCAWKDEQHV